MLIATLVCLVALAAVLFAVYREPGVAAGRWRSPAEFGLLPDVAATVNADFPLSWRGYEPGAVDRHVRAIAQAYADLVAAADGETLQRALQRAAVRAGLPELAAPQEEPSGEPHEPGER